MLEHERAGKPKDDSERHGDTEGEEEDSHAVEERQDVDLLAMKLGEGSAKWTRVSSQRPMHKLHLSLKAVN